MLSLTNVVTLESNSSSLAAVRLVFLRQITARYLLFFNLLIFIKFKDGLKLKSNLFRFEILEMHSMLLSVIFTHPDSYNVVKCLHLLDMLCTILSSISLK